MNPYFDLILPIFALNCLLALTCYEFGKRKGRTKQPEVEAFFDDRPCICGHECTSHTVWPDRTQGWGDCKEQLTRVPDGIGSQCVCQRYMPQTAIGAQ